MADMKHVVTTIPWSDAERTLLRQLWDNGMGVAAISRHLGRSKHSVHGEIRTLGLKRRPNPVTVKPQVSETPKAPTPKVQPLRPGARTLPPLPSELQGEP